MTPTPTLVTQPPRSERALTGIVGSKRLERYSEADMVREHRRRQRAEAHKRHAEEYPSRSAQIKEARAIFGIGALQRLYEPLVKRVAKA